MQASWGGCDAYLGLVPMLHTARPLTIWVRPAYESQGLFSAQNNAIKSSPAIRKPARDSALQPKTKKSEVGKEKKVQFNKII